MKKIILFFVAALPLFVAAQTQLTNQFLVVFPKPLDNRIGKFASGQWQYFTSVSEANNAPQNPLAYRYKGMTIPILIGGVVSEYWYRDTTINSGLVLKSTGGSNYTAGTGINIASNVISVANVPLTSAVSGILPVANGGTGTATPGLVQGSNVTITGTWPNQTINASGGGGGVTKGYVDSQIAIVNARIDTNLRTVSLAGLGAKTLWLRADSAIVVNGSNEVTAWTDVSGSGNSLTPVNAGTQPIYHASMGPANLPFLEFDGSRSLINNSFNLGGSTFDITLFFVVKNNGSGDRYLYELSTDAFVSQSGTYGSFHSTSDFISGHNGNNGLCISISPINNNWNLLIIQGKRGAVPPETHILINANTDSSGTYASFAADNTNPYLSALPFTLGSAYNAVGAFSICSLSEVMGYARALSAPEIDVVRKYFRNKFLLY